MFQRLTKQSPFAVVITAAIEEARRRGERRMGTQHLLLGLLHDPGSLPARALGVDLDTARAALDALDEEALAAIGLIVDRRPAEPIARKHPPVPVSALTSNARAVVKQAVNATTTRTRRTAPEHLLRALLDREYPDPVRQLLTHLGIDRTAAHRVLDQGGMP
ncbi:Clp protease N-terminal domain-containing protein [Flindersiella endophytica]